MISIRILGLFVLSLLASAAMSYGEEPVCHHCEEIREYNAKYHENFEYYDDYRKKEEPTPAASSSSASSSKEKVNAQSSSSTVPPAKK